MLNIRCKGIELGRLRLKFKFNFHSPRDVMRVMDSNSLLFFDSSMDVTKSKFLCIYLCSAESQRLTY